MPTTPPSAAVPRRLPAPVLAALLVLLVTLAAPTVPAEGATSPPTTAGLTLLEEQRLDDRLVELTFATEALTEPTTVRVLLPSDYDPRTRYPVLYLLHGNGSDYRAWVERGDARAKTDGLPLIVVMPDGGYSGVYSDWYNDGAFGPPRYETYHIRQLIPWIDAHYPTFADRSGRAVAGLSFGGFGAMSYAARFPDVFVAAASFSGAVDTNVAPVFDGTGQSLTGGGLPFEAWGPRLTEELRWRGHNPWDLADNLRGLHLTLRTGNGLPGGPYGGSDPIETLCWVMSTNMHERLDELDIPHVWDDYGPGGHGWEYWQRSLGKTLPDLMATFADPPAPPMPFDYTSFRPSYDIYGWTVRLLRPVLEFSTLTEASPEGFQLTGSGSAEVTTDAYYRPGRAYRVAVTGPYEHTTLTLTAGRDRRLAIPLTLGPANPFQQHTPQAALTGTKAYTATVTITPVAGVAGI